MLCAQGNLNQRSGQGASAARAAGAAFFRPPPAALSRDHYEDKSPPSRPPASPAALGTWSPRPKRRRSFYMSDTAAGPGTAAPALPDLTAVYQPAARRRAATDASDSRPAAASAAAASTADLFVRAADVAMPALAMHPGVYHCLVCFVYFALQFLRLVGECLSAWPGPVHEPTGFARAQLYDNP